MSTPEEVADGLAEVLGVDPESVMIDGRSGRISLALKDAEALLRLAR